MDVVVVREWIEIVVLVTLSIAVLAVVAIIFMMLIHTLRDGM